MGVRENLGAKPATESVEFINALVYGEPGAGKTYFIGSSEDCEAMTPALLLDIDGGAMTLRKRKGVDVIKVRKIKELEKISAELYADPDYYKLVALDTLTEMQKMDMHDLMHAAAAQNSKLDPLIPDQANWGKSNERIRLVIRSFKDLPCHTIMTAHRASKQENDGSTYFYPALPGKLSYEVPGFFDIVGYLDSKSRVVNGEAEVSRTMQTVKTNKVQAKDRTGVLPAVINEPSIPLLWEMIFGN